MAIVQISRIQHRRGTGEPPQLASGEIAWSLDQQKLYIGSGSTTEGAPAVKNVEVLTENTDILTLANQYAYRNLLNTTALSFQQKLDQNATVLDFGAKGDGATNDAPAIQAAIDSLYLNSTPDEKVILRIPAGEYILNSTVYVPPFVTLVGDGIGNTKLVGQYLSVITETTPVLQTVSGLAQPGGPYTFPSVDIQEVDTPQVNQARNIEISGMTIQQNRKGPGLRIDHCARSHFHDLHIVSDWQDSWGDVNPDESLSIGIYITNSGGIAPCKENIFENVTVHDFRAGAQILHNHADYNTFKQCNFKYLKNGIIISDQGATTDQPSHNNFEGCTFDLISNEGIRLYYGDYNTSSNNKFNYVGVAWTLQTPDYETPVTPVIDFGDIHFTNQSINDYFLRFNQLSEYDPGNGEYQAEVNGRVDYQNMYRNSTEIGYTLEGVNEFKNIISFAAIPNQAIYIDYLYTASAVTSDVYHKKEGTMIVNYRSDGVEECILEDNGTVLTNKTENLNETEFAVELVTDSTEKRIIVSCKSLLTTDINLDDLFVYKVRVKS